MRSIVRPTDFLDEHLGHFDAEEGVAPRAPRRGWPVGAWREAAVYGYWNDVVIEPEADRRVIG